MLNGSARSSDDRFYINIHKMELERVKYMLKLYLRTRLFKIEKFIVYIIEADQASILSEGEMLFAWTLYSEKKALFHNSFFETLPKKLDPYQKDSLDKRMITEPNLNEFVFVRFLKTY